MTSNLAVHFSSKKQDWGTPQDFFDELNGRFNFTLDPCASRNNAKCDKYFTVEENGLVQSWQGETVFMNPPYGRQIVLWKVGKVKKAFLTSRELEGENKTMNLPKWFEMQKKLDEHIIEKKELQGQDLLPNTILALQVELGELANEWRRIPTHDILGQKIKVGEKAILFNRHGISFEGKVVQRGGKRWLEIGKGAWIGGIGNHFMIKG